MALSWTTKKPQKPYTLQFYDNFYASFLIDGMLNGEPFNFTLTSNWQLKQTGLGGPTQNTFLGRGYLVRRPVYVRRTALRFIGGGNGTSMDHKFYDDSLDDKLGGEYQRLGG